MLASRSHTSPGQCPPPRPSVPSPQLSVQPLLIGSPPRYWLWYTTKTCVEGLARKAWERLRLHRVNLIALQRRRDPEQVLLQCLPRNKVGAESGGREDRVGGQGACTGLWALGSEPVGARPPGGRRPAEAAGPLPGP